MVDESKPVRVKKHVFKGRPGIAHYKDQTGRILPEFNQHNKPPNDDYRMVTFPKLGVTSAWSLSSLENVDAKAKKKSR